MEITYFNSLIDVGKSGLIMSLVVKYLQSLGIKQNKIEIISIIVATLYCIAFLEFETIPKLIISIVLLVVSTRVVCETGELAQCTKETLKVNLTEDKNKNTPNRKKKRGKR